jgi:hypothetical protein
VSIVTDNVRVVSETCMSRRLGKWVVPFLAPLFRLLKVVYRDVACNGRLDPTPLLRILGVMSHSASSQITLLTTMRHYKISVSFSPTA